jgi:hypothetical protein
MMKSKIRFHSYFVISFVLGSLAATATEAQQQASCEQNRLQCQKDWAQKNIDGVPVTPPDKTKMCWDGFYACTSAEPPAAQPPAPAPPPTAACEQQRLTCQKTWAQNNSLGVPVTPPDKTKLCWDGFYACTSAGGAKQETAPTAKPDAAPKTAALPPMKRFAMQTRSGGIWTMIIEECRINENEVRCMGRRQQTFGQPPYHQPSSDEYTLTGQISGAVITGVLSWRHVSRYVWNGCGQTGEFSAPATVTLRPNGEAILHHGSRPVHWTRTGPAICAEVEPTTIVPESQQAMSWRVLE